MNRKDFEEGIARGVVKAIVYLVVLAFIIWLLVSSAQQIPR